MPPLHCVADSSFHAACACARKSTERSSLDCMRSGLMLTLTDLPDPGARGVPRYASSPLPAYRYVPGRHPHPLRDPLGHSYAASAQAVPAAWQLQDWPQLDAWLFGVDLFNAFYFWEAHEAWESLWAR